MAFENTSVLQRWSITRLDVLPEFNGYQNMIYRICWTLESHDLFGGVHVKASSTTLDPTKIDEFSSLSDLTEAQILSWLDPDMVYRQEIVCANMAINVMRPEMSDIALPWNTTGSIE